MFVDRDGVRAAVAEFADRVDAAAVTRGRVLLEGLARDAARPAAVYSDHRLWQRVTFVASALGRIDQRTDARNIGGRLSALAGGLATAGHPVDRAAIAAACQDFILELPVAVRGL